MPRTRASVKDTASPPLAGTVIKVDDVTSSKDILVKKLESLGGRVVGRLQRNLTHVVFVKDTDDVEGDGRRLARVMEYRSGQCAGLAVVSVGWVEACARSGTLADVVEYEVEAGGKKRGVPPRLQLGEEEGSRKRGRVARKGSKGSKAMTPRAVETLEVDADRLDSSRRLRAGGGFRDADAVGDGTCTDDGADKVKKSSKATKGKKSEASERAGSDKRQEKSGRGENAENSKKVAKKPQPAIRFSTRCLRQYPSRPVKLDKSLPEGPVEVKKILKQTVGGHAPIPEIKRVESPWGTPQTSSRLPVGVIGNLDLRTVSKANVRDATASTRKLIKEVPSPWSVVRVYDNIPVEREVYPNSVYSTHRRSLLGGAAGGGAGSHLGGHAGMQSQTQTQTPMSAQGVRMNRSQVQSLRMSIQRHESAMHHGSQNMSPNPSPLVLSGCTKKNPIGLSALGPSSQAPPMFVEEAVAQNKAGTMEDVATDGDVNDEYGTQVTTQVDETSHANVAAADPMDVVQPDGVAENGEQPAAHSDRANDQSMGHSAKLSMNQTIYYSAHEALTQGVSQQITQPLNGAGTNVSQLQLLQPSQPQVVQRLSQEMLTIPTPSQLSVRSDEDVHEDIRDDVEEDCKDRDGLNEKEEHAEERNEAPAVATAAPSSQSPTQEVATQKSFDTTQTPPVKSGTIAFTSVSQAVLSSCKEAIATLPGLVPWSSTSRKSSPITHLIIGDNRRTFKTMLAVMHGAHLLRPEYVTDSLATGHWLDEEAYLADVVFQSGAAKARAFLSGARNTPGLLKGKKLAIYNGKRATTSTDTYHVVRRICQELGGTLFHISEADIVIIMNDEESSRPSGLKDSAIAVRREWLFQSACEYDLLPMAEFEHVFGKIISGVM